MIRINPQEILELVRAGYTKEEINNMIQPEPKKEPDSEPKKEPDSEPKKEPDSEPKKEPDSEPKKEPDSEPKELNALKEELSNLKKMIQKQNIDNSGKNSPPPLTASDALASLITKNK